MGTSASSKGNRGRNPLVPDWADDQPGVPLPPADPQRYRSFRSSFGSYLAGGGGKSNLERSLGKFARKATGGAKVGPRRLGRVVSAGGSLVSALSDIAQGRDVAGFDASRYVGKPVETFSQALSELVTGNHPDSDWVNAAIQEAIEIVLDFEGAFDPENLTDDNIFSILSEFISQSIFQLIVSEAGNSWKHSGDIENTIKCEGEILDLTREHVEQSLLDQVAEKGRNFEAGAVQDFIRTAAKDVWQEWEGYDD
ncbi:hypothetical protein [Celeribacter sp.]|uniref:hypothetical protein n=1 Tax=Celeribacter sp. TaxID=1890673 RepID=UPI003A8E5B03